MPDPEIHVSTTVGANVFEGVQLYGELTGEADADRSRRWIRAFFQENPIGTGLFVSARLGERLVGFISLIDLEMRIGGKPVKGGKAEFWSVRPECLKLTVGGDRLPWALFQTLRRAASDNGYHAIQTVSPQGSRPLRRAGDKPLDVVLDTWVAPQLPTNRYLRGIDKLFFRRLRISYEIHRLRALAGGVSSRLRRISDLSEPVAHHHPNALIHASPQMVNIRFPHHSYLKYLLDRPEGKPCLFVFDRPVTQKPCVFRHASDRADEAEWAAVMAGVLAEAQRNNASSLNMDIPACLDASLRNLGLKQTGTTRQICFLHDATGDGLDGEWLYSHAHMGLYRAIP